MREDVLRRRERCGPEASLEGGREKALGVRLGRLDQDTQVERGAGDAVEDGCHPPPDDQVAHVMALEAPEHVPQSVEHP